MWIKELISLIVFRSIFDIVLSHLLKIKPQLFSPLYKVTGKWGGKRIYKWVAFVIIMIPFAAISVYLDFNYIIDGIIVGFVLTMCDIAFREAY
jgi:hypothetical protein